MVGRIAFLPDFEFAKLVQPCQGPLDVPTGFAQAAAVGRPPLRQDRLYPPFLSLRR